MTDEDDLPTKLKALHNAGTPLRRIAVVTRMPIEEVEAHMAGLKLKPRVRSARSDKGKAHAKPVPNTPPAEKENRACATREPSTADGVLTASTNWKINPTKYALNILSDRARYTPQGFTFDGHPIGSFALIRKANRVLKDAGQPQMDACWEWIIRD